MKINTLRDVIYVALDFATGITDLTLNVRKPDGTVLAPIILTEQGDGIYTASYTPDILGVWQEKITSVSNSDKVFRSNIVEAVDISDVKVVVDSNGNKIDDLDAKADTIISKEDAIKTAVDLNTTKLDTIDGKVESLSIEIKSGGYFI
jgi:hypothetical protein